jgi:hypothetical protein
MSAAHQGGYLKKKKKLQFVPFFKCNAPIANWREPQYQTLKK